MRPTLLVARTAVLLAAVVLAPSAWCGNAKEGSKMLNGSWSPTAAELGGKPFPEETLRIIKLTVTEGKYRVTVGDKPDEGTVKIDPTKKPPTMEITGTKGPNQGKTFLAIYKVDGDTLTVCYDLSGKAYPTEFKSKADTALYLVTYKRDKQ